MVLIAALSVFLFSTQVHAAGMFCPNPTENDQENKDVARKYFQMGLGYSEQADHRKCIEAFECVLKLIPYSTSARYQLAKALDDGGQYTRAKKEYQLFLTTADKADPLRQKVQDRLTAIETLADKPLPPEAGEVAVEKMKEDLREELNRKLAELQKANKAAGELEKEKQRLQEEYKKKEAEKLAELNEKIRQLSEKAKPADDDAKKKPGDAPQPKKASDDDFLPLLFAGLGATRHSSVLTFNQNMDLVSEATFPSTE
jgi:tetratricopeptide (TPR) repeat protein